MTVVGPELCTEQTAMKLDFEKYADGLIPAIVQDSETGTVLMLGFMMRKLSS